MAERPLPPDNEQLERALRDLGPRLAYPPTPDIARAVRARLAAVPPPRRSPWRDLVAAPWPWRLALALTLLVVLGGVVLALSATARRAVAGRLGLPGIAIVYATPTPLPPTAPPLPGRPATAATPATPALPTPTSAATPAAIGERLRLGQAVTLAEARRQVRFPVLVPTLPDLGPPDAVYVGIPPVGGQVALVWLGRPALPPVAQTGVGLLLTEFTGRLDPTFLKKIPGEGTRLKGVTVDGNQGYWFEGDPHEFAYQDANGQFTTATTRLAGNVLIWEQGGVTFRLEGARTEDEALRIAASVR
jgi:hypothetical protein